MGLVTTILLVVLLIYIYQKIPVWKGKYAEKLVDKILSRLPEDYITFNDLLFKSNGYTVQIDHITVSPYGVFVIETKGYQGWITGGENSEYWTQTIFKSKHKFYNPIRQNDGHVRFLRYLLKCSVDIPFIPIVVFNNDADLMVHVWNHCVINRSYLMSAITRYKTPLLNKNTIEWIVKTNQNNTIVTTKNDFKQHKQNTQYRQYRSRSLINQGTCRRCGGQLILRQAKYGYFYGCTNYPKCKFTLNCN